MSTYVYPYREDNEEHHIVLAKREWFLNVLSYFLWGFGIGWCNFYGAMALFFDSNVDVYYECLLDL